MWMTNEKCCSFIWLQSLALRETHHLDQWYWMIQLNLGWTLFDQKDSNGWLKYWGFMLRFFASRLKQRSKIRCVSLLDIPMFFSLLRQKLKPLGNNSCPENVCGMWWERLFDQRRPARIVHSSIQSLGLQFALRHPNRSNPLELKNKNSEKQKHQLWWLCITCSFMLGLK